MPDGMINPMNVDYDGLIPNNVGLNADGRVRKALETWHPGIHRLVEGHGARGLPGEPRVSPHRHQRGPEGLGQVRLREACRNTSGACCWPPRSRAARSRSASTRASRPGRRVPGEYRAMLRRLITIQGDTEPASVEQQRHLGQTAPSLYDMRNLFQVNVEEGRHLWAMVYLLQKYFGAEGREEADDLLRRRSGDADSPRMLGAFNEATPDWLSRSSCSPTSPTATARCSLRRWRSPASIRCRRTCRFMLTEEAHHMFVGDSGVSRAWSSGPARPWSKAASPTRTMSSGCAPRA